MSDIVVSLPSNPELHEAFAGQAGIDVVEWDLDGPAPRDEIDMIVTSYMGDTTLLANIEGVRTRLVQHLSIGYDNVHLSLPAGVPFANAASVHEASTAELTVGLMLALQRHIPDFVRDGDRGAWNSVYTESLADRRVLLIGYGGVCKAVEARLAGFETEITRLARTAREDTNLAGETVPVHGFDELHERLAEAEIVVVAVPLSDSTRGMFDAAALAAMPDGAMLVNVARGPVVDTDALVAELQSGRLRAALDVTEPEPLPQDHPLWTCPNTLISPHVGGRTSAFTPRLIKLIGRQIEHLRAGETPENLISFD